MQVQFFKKDERVKQQLRSGETIGCFYVESPAMRGLLKKLQCDNYRSLVAASSIIRPGVARSGMMREYIYRFHHPGKFKYLHPVMEEQLKETYGVMVYQEDVLKICHHFAGLDLADADVIRRAMSGKYRSKKELQRIIDKFFENCRNFGYPEEVTKGGVAADRILCRLLLFQSPFSLLCRGELPEPLPESPLPPGVHGWSHQ